MNRTATNRAFRGPFARWPRAADAVLALAVFLGLLFVVNSPSGSLAVRGGAPLPELPVLAVTGAALYWRRRAPVVVLGVALGAWVLLLAGSAHTIIGCAVIIANYCVGRYVVEPRWGPAGTAVAVTLIVLEGPDGPRTPSWQGPVFGGLIMLVAWYVGRRLRLRAERAEQLVREQAAEARRIVTEERTRIARELHDVVAHRVSLMTVQAGAAKAVATRDPDGALKAMGAVEEAGRQALAELRHLLGVLRPADGLDGLGPQPGLADLPKLVERMRAAGVEVALAGDDAPAGPIPARVDLFAYRIVQEALTNVLKHAGPGTRAEVRLGSDRREVAVEVVDDGGGIAAALPSGGAGHGIVGMRERALLLGGTLDAGPESGGGFRVTAHLPTGGEPV